VKIPLANEEYFVKYASKVSKMNAWMIEEELARKLVTFDEAEEKTGLREKTMHEIEILHARKGKKATVSKEPNEEEIERMKKWLLKATDWDLSRELDKYKSERDSCQRRIGLMEYDAKGDSQNFQAVNSESDLKERIIMVLKEEMQKRGIRT
jgi:hypothetical protein